MPKIEFATDWKGTHGTKGWSNHESSLNEDEMRALVLKIKDVEGMTGAAPDTMNAKFKKVNEALAGGDDVTITVTKGIHQRTDKTHFDIQVPGATGTFHVFVVVGDVQIVSHTYTNYSGTRTIQRKLGQYKPSGLSASGGGPVILTWPATFALSDLEKPVGRPRGYSLSTGNSHANPTGAEVVRGISDYHRIITPTTGSK